MLPLVAWMAYVRWKFGPTGEVGINNFTLPFRGLVEKWSLTLFEFLEHPGHRVQFATLVTLLASNVQFGFLVSRWRPADVWWRVGAAFAGLMVFLSTPVWEGYPGAFARVLLPMAVAFNVLVPRSGRWLPLLLAGNLSVVATWHEFSPPEREYLRLSGPPEVVSHVSVTLAEGWYGPESNRRDRWQWTSGPATVLVRNGGSGPVLLTWRGRIAALDPQGVRIQQDATLLWSGAATDEPGDFQFTQLIPPGDTRLRFVAEKPPRPVADDPRPMALKVLNLEIVMARPTVQP
jgi:hypothetical protein